MSKLDRRQFLQASAAAAFASTPGVTFAQGVGTGAPFPDYKALVCVFLFGGNDSFNMLVPRSAAEYGVYAQSRQNLAVAQQDLLPITTPTTVQYGLHPSMGGVKNLFDAGRVAFVNNVGPLVEPTTKAQYLNQSVQLPPQLFSHNDQQDQWHSLKGAATSKTGWAGRVADLIRTNVSDQQMATNASLFGSSLFQSAEETIAYVMGPQGPIPFDGFGDTTPFLEQRQAFENIITATYNSVYERAFAEIQQRATASADLVTNAIGPGWSGYHGVPAKPVGQSIADRRPPERGSEIRCKCSGRFSSWQPAGSTRTTIRWRTSLASWVASTGPSVRSTTPWSKSTWPTASRRLRNPISVAR